MFHICLKFSFNWNFVDCVERKNSQRQVFRASTTSPARCWFAIFKLVQTAQALRAVLRAFLLSEMMKKFKLHYLNAGWCLVTVWLELTFASFYFWSRLFSFHWELDFLFIHSGVLKLWLPCSSSISCFGKHSCFVKNAFGSRMNLNGTNLSKNSFPKNFKTFRVNWSGIACGKSLII